MASTQQSRIKDPARLAVLNDAQLLASTADDHFDRIAHLASKSLDTPVVLICFIDDHREYFSAFHGLAEPWTSLREIPLSQSLGRYLVASADSLAIGDTRLDPRTRDNPSITELGAVAYAGAPIRTAGGHVLGGVCAMDNIPRDWQPGEVQRLELLAAVTAREIDQRLALRRAQQRADHAGQRLEEMLGTVDRFRTLVERSLAGVYLVQDGRFLYVNPRFCELFGYTPKELRSERPMMELVAEEDRARVLETIRKHADGEEESLRYRYRGVCKDGQVFHAEVHETRTDVDGSPAVIGTLVDVSDRMQTEEKLRRSQAHFRSLLENAWDIIQVVDRDCVVRYVSPAAKRVLDRSPEEMIGRQASEFIHPDDVPDARRALEATFSHPGQPEFAEIRLKNRGGAYRTVQMVGEALVTDAGEPVAIVNIHDVTDRRRAEAALRENEERYRLVVHATQSAVWDWDRESGAVLWNGESGRVLRYRDGEMRPSIDWWYSRVHPEDRTRVAASLREALEGTGDDWTQEHRFQRGDGTYAMVLDSGAVMRDTNGRAIRLIGAMQDVTERRRSEQMKQFLASASLLLDESLDHEITCIRLARLVVPTLADYCRIDLVDGGALDRVAVAHADPAVEGRILRRQNTPESDPGKWIADRVLRSGEPMLIPSCTDAVLNRSLHAKNAREHVRDLGASSMMVVPLAAYDQRMGAITLASTRTDRRFGPIDLAVAEDLARRVSLVVRHAYLYADAQNAIGMRDEVLAMVSHDLRNPLNSIFLTANLLLDQASERRSSNVQYLEIIHDAADQMNSMIEDLVDAAQMAAGHFVVEPSECDATGLISEALGVFEPLAGEKSIQLRSQVDEDVPVLRVDSQQFLRILSNLVGNAIKFTPEGGMIEIRVRRQDGSARFEVSDTGPGIPPEQLPHVFDRYWQARRGDRRGAGLGLAIAAGIVEAHDGDIWVKSTPTEGTTFIFTIPVEPM